MVWDRGPPSFFCVWIPVVPASSVVKLFFPPTEIPSHLADHLLAINVRVYFRSLHSLPLTYISLCQCCRVLVIIALWFWSLKVSPPTWAFSRLFWIFWVPCNSKWILGSACWFLPKKGSLDFDRDFVESRDYFGKHCHLHIKFYDSSTWDILIIWLFFSLFQ